MKLHAITPRRCSGGFTLIECIIVIVVLAIAGTGIAAMHGKMFSGQAALKDLQVRTRLMEECAEQVLAKRRFTVENAYESVVTGNFGANNCGNITALGTYAIPSVNIVAYTGPTCPDGRTCSTVTISHNGMTPLTLMLVDY